MGRDAHIVARVKRIRQNNERGFQNEGGGRKGVMELETPCVGL